MYWTLSLSGREHLATLWMLSLKDSLAAALSYIEYHTQIPQVRLACCHYHASFRESIP